VSKSLFPRIHPDAVQSYGAEVADINSTSLQSFFSLMTALRYQCDEATAGSATTTSAPLPNGPVNFTFYAVFPPVEGERAPLTPAAALRNVNLQVLVPPRLVERTKVSSG
jgi:hypothetical protein